MFSCNEKNKVLILKALLVICLSASSPAAQSTTDLQKLLQEKAGLTQTEISELEGGKPVVKLLASKDVREISVFGAIKLDRILDLDAASFRESLSQRGGKVMLDSGTFSRPPTIADFEALGVDVKDIEDLRNCVTGRCNVKLSAEMISRINKQIDWNSPDHAAEAARLYKELVVEKVRAYSEAGDKALIEYADQRKPVDLRRLYPSLLERSVFIRFLAPEFEKYLEAFPQGNNTEIEDRLEWSRVKSGLKPIITITHSSTYQKRVNDGPQIMLVTKQIYASHYIDALLALTALVTADDGGQKNSYLVFSSISYSESLSGALGRLAHPVVEREAIEKATDILQRGAAQMNARARTPTGQDPSLRSDEVGSWSAFFRRNWFSAAAGGLALVFLIVFFVRRYRR